MCTDTSSICPCAGEGCKTPVGSKQPCGVPGNCAGGSHRSGETRVSDGDGVRHGW
jgi:hypothetical protein